MCQSFRQIAEVPIMLVQFYLQRKLATSAAHLAVLLTFSAMQGASLSAVYIQCAPSTYNACTILFTTEVGHFRYIPGCLIIWGEPERGVCGKGEGEGKYVR